MSTNGEERLLQAWRALAPRERELLNEFADMLAQRYGARTAANGAPLRLVRPDEETIVQAIRRLTRTYPMLDRSRLLDEGSRLLARHAADEITASAAIDVLEELYAQAYAQLKD